MRIYSPPTASHLAARTARRADVLIWIAARNRGTGATETIGFWTGDDHQDFQIGSETRTYLGAGNLLGVDPLKWRTGLTVRTQRVRLSQVSPEAQQAIRGYDTRHAPVELHRAFFDAGGVLIDAPHLLMRGFVDKVTLTTPEKGGSGDVSMEIASAGRALTKPLNRYRSNASLVARAPTDTFRKYASTTDKVEVPWGRASTKGGDIPLPNPKDIFGGGITGGGIGVTGGGISIK